MTFCFSNAVKSQVLYLTSLGLSSVRRGRNEAGEEFFLISEKDLGLAINMESKLVSNVSSRPSFNFIAYIPTIAQTPLHIESELSSVNRKVDGLCKRRRLSKANIGRF